MIKYIFSTLIIVLSQNIFSQINPPKLYEHNKTLDYYSLISEYAKIANSSDKAKLITYGKTDSGKPLHLLVISKNKVFNPEALRKQNKRIVLINNGIHPGEPAGIEASLQLAAELLTEKPISAILENTVICIIPIYNIGGMLNRSPYNRANQNGPEECGFRGNARNIDLNRDYMVCQTANAKSFTQIFQEWQPDVFLETHTTDGSDHQQTLTIITTAHQDLPPMLGDFLNKKMRPELYKMMQQTSKYKVCPYVTVWRDTPDNGYSMFLESPRFSTGYASLFNTLSFMTENHIFKPFEDRVLSCLDFMHCLLNYTSANSDEIAQLRQQANNYLDKQKEFVLTWKIDSSRFDYITFDGYEASYLPSKLTGEPLLHYNRNKPYTKQIKYYNGYNSEITVKAPDYYILPQAWHKTVERLKLNNVKMTRLKSDTSITLEMYYITSYETYDSPYNGHYPHYNIKLSPKVMKVNFYKDDYIIPVKGDKKYYLIQALEPNAPDSFFSWNLFDEILQSREYFSPFIFEERAMQILDTTPGLKEQLHVAIAKNPDMKKNTYLQMRFIYRHSPYFEKTYMRYPVGRVNGIL
jgi:hypothetical protein